MERAVAVVGTRRATSAGRTTAGRIATALVAAEAPRSSRASRSASTARPTRPRSGPVARRWRSSAAGTRRSGRTRTRRLADAIVAAGGAVVSELAPDVEPSQRHVPAAEPDHQRPERRDGRRRGAGPQRRADHGLLGARTGPRRASSCRAPSTRRASAGCLAFLREWPGAPTSSPASRSSSRTSASPDPAHGSRRRASPRPRPRTSARAEGAIARELVAGPRHGRRARRDHRPAGRDGPRRPDAARAAGPGGGRPRPLSPGRSAARRATTDPRTVTLRTDSGGGCPARGHGATLPARHAPADASGHSGPPRRRSHDAAAGYLYCGSSSSRSSPSPCCVALYAATALRPSGLVARERGDRSGGRRRRSGRRRWRARPSRPRRRRPTSCPLTQAAFRTTVGTGVELDAAGDHRVHDADGARLGRGCADASSRATASSSPGAPTTRAVTIVPAAHWAAGTYHTITVAAGRAGLHRPAD